MPFPVAGGGANYTGNFIPELWSSKLIVNFYDATVLAAISNTDYEGEIKQYGDKVNIRTTPELTIRDRKKAYAFLHRNRVSDTLVLNIPERLQLQLTNIEVTKCVFELLRPQQTSDVIGTKGRLHRHRYLLQRLSTKRAALTLDSNS